MIKFCWEFIVGNWESILNEDGIVVKVEPCSKRISAEELLAFDIWIYADTWGVYLEEIQVDINEILPFYFNVLIEVVGNPIEFPLAKNSVLEMPTFR